MQFVLFTIIGCVGRVQSMLGTHELPVTDESLTSLVAPRPCTRCRSRRAVPAPPSQAQRERTPIRSAAMLRWPLAAVPLETPGSALVNEKTKVLVAGIGGASLGTEVVKCLAAAGTYDVLGCDISAMAFGHFSGGVSSSFVVSAERYADDVLELCARQQIAAVLPGGEGPLDLLSRASERFIAAGVLLASNSPSVISLCSNKQTFFDRMATLDLPCPVTVALHDEADLLLLDAVPTPCVIKPAVGTGGSSFVFLAADRSEARLYAEYLLRNRKVVLAQEYVREDEGEFTVGVLSFPDGTVHGSIALRRVLQSKLSVLVRTDVGVISTGYSQGLIDDFPSVRAQAEKIARAIGSVGPINVQGRMRHGILVPFEVNPRFSASTYLRTMAGYNEIDIFLQKVLHGRVVAPTIPRPGYYLRSLTEVFAARDSVTK